MKQYIRVKEYQKRLTKNMLLADVTKEISKDAVDLEEKRTSGSENEKEVVRDVTNYVLAPALNGFVAWVLAESMKQGIKRLYFLARDGYFMYQTAKFYVEELGLPIECKYLYCSRYSIRVPNYHLDTQKALDYITLGGLDITAKKLYKRAGFDREQRRRMYEEKVLPLQKEEQIPRDRLPEIKKVLGENESFMEILQENSCKAFPGYEQYLKQEGLLEEIPMALVDSGWVGSMQKELNLSLQKLGKKDSLKGFYWGLYELPQDTQRKDYFTYFFSPEGEMKRKTSFNNCLFESIFTAPHGMTLGYEERNDEICPVFSEISEERKDRLRLMEETIKQWQKRFLKSVRKAPDLLLEQMGGKEVLTIIERNLEAFMHHPTKAEASAFGEIEFTDDILEYRGNKIATNLNEKELVQNHFIGKLWTKFSGNKEHVRQSAWYEGSAVVYGKHPGYHIFHYSCYKYAMNYRKQMIWRRRYEGN